jgi:phosphonate transport system substrate-binding protein
VPRYRGARGWGQAWQTLLSWQAVSELSFAAAAGAEETHKAVHEFCIRLGAVTGLSVVPHMSGSYAELIEETANGSVDLAWAPPLVAVELENRKSSVALVAVTRSMRSAYHSALFSRNLSVFRHPQDLVNATVAWVSRESASGYFVPRWHLQSLGLSLGACFKEELFRGSHQAVARAVLDSQADVGATHVALDPLTGQLVKTPWQTLGAGKSSIRVLMLVGPIPGDVIAAGQHVPVATRRRLTAALLSMNEKNSTTAFDAVRFEPVPEGHLRLLKRLYTYAGSARP